MIGISQLLAEAPMDGTDRVTSTSRDAWRQRFRTPLIEHATLAARRPERGLVVSAQDGRTVRLSAWDVAGQQLTALTDGPHDVREGWIDPTGSFVYHLRDEDGTELGHLVRTAFEGGPAQDVTPGLAPYTLRGLGFSRSGRVLAVNPVNADGFALYAIDLLPRLGTPRLLFRDTWETWGALLSARGDLAACWSTARAGGIRRHTLLVFDAVTGDLVGELDDGRQAGVVGVGFSPVEGDDRILASTTRNGYLRPVVWDPRSGHRLDLTVDELDGDVRPLDWSADARRLLLCQLGGAQQLHVHELDTGRLTTLDHPQGTYVEALSGTATFGPRDTIVGLRATATTPPEFVELDGHTGHQRRTLLSSADAPPTHPWRSVTFHSSDATPVQAWIAAPRGTGPFPTILEVHGGPHLAVDECYDPGVQCWLDAGYAWMSVNYRGSTGFGREFAEQIWGELGHWELEDMVAGREWLIDHGISRPDEIFVHGGSYGGYLTLLALGKRPDLWVAGMALVAIGDLVAGYEQASDALRAAKAGWMLGTPSERPEAWRASSPITYAAGVTAPVLVIQARNDTRTPAGQLENYERRMRALGKDIRVVWLDGGHRSLGPDVWVRCYETMLDFAAQVLDRHRAATGAGAGQHTVSGS
jgi:dipeptidyl aminopeptidase/acylaminoacyl peptidase